MRNVVIKVGGSLLSLPDLPLRLRAMFEAVSADRLILLAGGGSAADLVRQWDAIHKLGSETAHWLAIDSMTLTAMLLAKILPETELVTSRRLVTDHDQRGRIVILQPREILAELQSGTDGQLPVGWDCTSDSIAGWIALQLQADAMLLAKSVDAPSDSVNDGESEAIDRCFASLVLGQIPVYWCNVRSCPESVTLWKDAV